jgi:hypothetical protein
MLIAPILALTLGWASSAQTPEGPAVLCYAITSNAIEFSQKDSVQMRKDGLKLVDRLASQAADAPRMMPEGLMNAEVITSKSAAGKIASVRNELDRLRMVIGNSDPSSYVLYLKDEGAISRFLTTAKHDQALIQAASSQPKILAALWETRKTLGYWLIPPAAIFALEHLALSVAPESSHTFISVATVVGIVGMYRFILGFFKRHITQPIQLLRDNFLGLAQSSDGAWRFSTTNARLLTGTFEQPYMQQLSNKELDYDKFRNVQSEVFHITQAKPVRTSILESGVGANRQIAIVLEF